MELCRSDEERLIAHSVRRCLEDARGGSASPTQTGAPDRLATWRRLAGLGMLQPCLYGDATEQPPHPRTAALLLFEFGHAIAVLPALECALVSGRLLAQGGHSPLLDSIAAGERLVVPVHDGGGDPFCAPRLCARRLPSGYYELSGTVAGVRHAGIASDLLVAAGTDEGPALFLIPAREVVVHERATVDRASAARLVLDGLTVPDASRLRFDPRVLDAGEALAEAYEWGVFGAIAETAGLAARANEATFRYLCDRQQFGVPLARFQALQHRVADMKIAAEEILALLNLCIEALRSPRSDARSALICGTKALVDDRARRIGHEAIQLHGGMGVSDECEVSHIGRRLMAIRCDFGSAELHLRRFGHQQNLPGLLAFQESAETQSWRREVAQLTRAHLPDSIRRKTAAGCKLDKADIVGWQKVLAGLGLFGCSWPREFGGKGWTLGQQVIFNQESSVQGAPPLSPYGVKMVGPVLHAFGSDAQRAQHLPGILSSDVWWCQGYSEPGAGSDLASLRTSAVRDGDHYIVNGSKLWTTEAHWADWMHCLVRTDTQGKAQEGITFLLIDMRSPGISIRPIITIDGVHHTNATFFDNVRVPVAQRVGAEGQGWTIAKFLLGNERASIADTGPKLRLLARVQSVFRAAAEAGTLAPGLLETFARRLADVSLQLLTLCALELQYVETWDGGRPAGVETSILKIRGSEVYQSVAELGAEIAGVTRTTYDLEFLSGAALEQSTDPAAETSTAMLYEYLFARCWSIFGGSNEIQRNLLARSLVAA